jgi:RNA polymerase I-specific transcription initiation factor RRN5
MSSASEFAPDQDESGLSDEELATTPHPPSAPTPSPLSATSLSPLKGHLDGEYNDAYRLLYNETVAAASVRFVADENFQPNDAMIGVSKWSAKEKSMLFAALDRLGRDEVPGIARAIGTKSIPETQAFLHLIQDASSKAVKRRNANIILEDIPAAVEVGAHCRRRLELAGDALAWYQERYEAKQEQERYGKYWLITPGIADEINQSPLRVKSPDSGVDAEMLDASHDPPVPQALQDIPEAELLNASTMLHLSKNYFMNPSPDIPYPWPHWTDLISEIATEPSIYRTAFNDMHALVVSLTRRLVQTIIIQATARIRTSELRASKGVSLCVRRRDVLTAVDLLGLSRNSRERWRGMARRCGLRVEKRIADGRGDKRPVNVPWNEVERLLGLTSMQAEPLSTDIETAGLTSGTEDENFRSRAMRGGTPLPIGRPADVLEDDQSNAIRREDSDSNSNGYRPSHDPVSNTSMSDEVLSDAHDSRDMSEDRLDALEAFDQAARREEEDYLWGLVGDAPAIDQYQTKLKTESAEPEVKETIRRPTYDVPNDWRSWTKYRATWEEMRTPIPLSTFDVSQTGEDPVEPAISIEQEPGSAHEYGYSPDKTRRRRQMRERDKTDLPIRGARAYAAMLEGNHVDVLAESGTEDKGDGAAVPVYSSDYDEDGGMDLD